MMGLLNAVILGAGLSLIGGLVLLLLGRVLERRDPHSGVELWRAARLAAIVPLILAPVIYFIPQAAPESVTLNPPVAPLNTVVAPPTPEAFTIPDSAILLTALYLMGLLASVLFAGLRHLRRLRLMRKGQYAGDLQLEALTGQASEVDTPTTRLLISDETRTPVLTGWRGVVVAPGQIFDDPEVARYALVHELVHLRRGDERDRLIGVALTTVFWFHWPLRQIEKHLDAAREIACDAEVLELLGGGARKPYAAALITMMRGGFATASAFGSKDRRHREMRIKSILSANEGKRSSKLALTSVLLMSWLPVACAQAMATERVANDREIHFVSHDDQVMHEVHEEIQIRQVEGEDGETRYEITVEGSGTPEEREARRLELLEQLENGEDGVAVFVTDARIAGHVAPEIVERLTGEDGARVAVRVHENIVLHEVDGAESDVNVFVRRIEDLDGVEMTEDVLRLESAGGHVVRLGDASENVVILDVDDVDAETVRSWTTEDGGQFEVIIARDAEGEVREWVSEDGRQVEVIVNGEPGDARVLEWEGEDGETVELRVIGDTEGARRVMRHVRVERAPEAPEEPEGESQDEPNKAPAVEPK
ncbi:MAG: M56 family metallopeptidase [Maricaulis sp.]|uniref:M56 family metallopeptidase n=1 Tax=Maricaulis sp. TaxID=1486257 RepID=UPI00261AF78B|nr:M56 family metallopeptidase [Maricaulis sp.]MDM7985327.1 M56 family metallopeptidase [Maricaulis sp.]